jgi:plastocyanin
MKKLNGSQSRLFTGMVFLFAILSISNSCTKQMDNMTSMVSSTGAKGGSIVPGTNEVWIQNMAYNPSVITITAGTTITWTNKDGVNHTVTSNTGAFDSGTISSNGTYSFTFTTAGKFQYYCIMHPAMVGSVVVN